MTPRVRDPAPLFAPADLRLDEHGGVFSSRLETKLILINHMAKAAIRHRSWQDFSPHPETSFAPFGITLVVTRRRIPGRAVASG